MEGFAEKEEGGLPEDAEEGLSVIYSKTENLLLTETEGETFSHGGEKTLLPLVVMEELEWREEAYVFAPPSFCLKNSFQALPRLINWRMFCSRQYLLHCQERSG